MIHTFKRWIKNIGWLTTGYRSIRDRIIASGSAALHPRGFRFIGPSSMQTGNFEPKETKFLIEQSFHFDAFVNVGANCGYYVCIARQLGLHVLAAEPHPLNYKPLLRNLEINKWNDVEVFPVALSEKPGLLKLYGSGTGASLIAGWAQSSLKTGVVVPVSTLDRIVGASLDGKRTLYWIDVEGAELTVLRGAKSQLTRTPPATWLIEITIADLQPNGTTVNPHLSDTFELFWGHGYKAYNLDGYKLVTREMVDRWQAGEDRLGGGNFIFLKADMQKMRSAGKDHDAILTQP